MTEPYFDPILGRVREQDVAPVAPGGGSTTAAASSNGNNAPLITKDEGTTLTSTTSSLNFVGSGVVATASGNDVTVTIGGGGTPAWGDITGTLSNQTDLQTALNAKASKAFAIAMAAAL